MAGSCGIADSPGTYVILRCACKAEGWKCGTMRVCDGSGSGELGQELHWSGNLLYEYKGLESYGIGLYNGLFSCKCKVESFGPWEMQ